MDVRKERKMAIDLTIAAIRNIENAQGVNLESLESIKEELLDLVKQKDLFPEDHFPIKEEDGNSVLYRLSEDEDNRFALYASIALPEKNVRPHNHTTWAVIVGICGIERNVFYKRMDDASVDGVGTVHPIGEFNVSHGNGITLMPDDIHSIHVTGKKKTIHLHMYGLALEQLHSRVMYDTSVGTYKIFQATSNIKVI